MYEFIFVVGGRDTPFTIIQNIPYRELVPNSVISELELGTACVLTVAEKADSPDPVSYFRIEVSQFICLFVCLCGVLMSKPWVIKLMPSTIRPSTTGLDWTGLKVRMTLAKLQPIKPALSLYH